MFELKLSYGNTRKSVAAEATDTISKAIRDNEISTQGATIAINGRILDTDKEYLLTHKDVEDFYDGQPITLFGV